jgi:hypothetical protein
VNQSVGKTVCVYSVNLVSSEFFCNLYFVDDCMQKKNVSHVLFNDTVSHTDYIAANGRLVSK